jgi:4'-phosphopantetheinyl transferase
MAHDWTKQSAPDTVGRGFVDVWRVPLNRENSADVERHLVPTERDRAARFHREGHRAQWIVARASLRQILGGYLGIEPSAVNFGVLEHGKPILIGSDCVYERLSAQFAGTLASVQFNLSHTDDLALVAVTIGNRVGVDIEFVNRTIDPLDLASAVFAQDEIDALRELPESERVTRFLEIWTMKEAWLKMAGCGLIDDLPTFSILNLQTIPEAVRPAHIGKLSPGHDYIAALALEADFTEIRTFEFVDPS